MLFNFPIEPIPERYSLQWDGWFNLEFDRLKVDWLTIHPPFGSLQLVRTGEYLDVLETHRSKFDQLRQLFGLYWFDDGAHAPRDGDVLFFHDIWFPGLEALFYVRDALKRDFKICGCLHAGAYDPHDFKFQNRMQRWARDLENCWFKEVDAIFVATYFHKDLVDASRSTGLTTFEHSEFHQTNVHVTGFPMYIKPESPEKQNIIVFPHRLAPEKQPEIFDYLAEVAKDFLPLPGWTFVKTKKVAVTKLEYYNTLRYSKIAFSSAQQETWGIAMQEAVMLGCVPLVPDRLAYRELYPSVFRYVSGRNMEDKLIEFANNYDAVIESTDYLSLRHDLFSRNTKAIGNMVEFMRKKGWNV